MQFRRDTIIRDYRIVDIIGEGGMGQVYVAIDNLERKVAIKVLNPSFTHEGDFIQRFKQEAMLQSSLDHEGIVKIHTFFEQNGLYFLVMEYVEGQTIRQLIQTVGPIPEARVLSLTVQVLKALEFAHSRGIVHRDIKPSNIIVTPKNTIKIVDFGVAKMLGMENLVNTQVGSKMGTYLYMSPEQVKSEENIGAQTDIYSFGIVIFEMLTGRVPYNVITNSEYALMQEIVNSSLPDPRKYYPHISNSLVNILSKMTVKDSRNRYITCSQVLIDIHRFTDLIHTGHTSVPTHFEKTGIVDVGQQPNERQPTSSKSILYVSLGVVAVLFIILSVGGYLMYQSKQEEKIRQREQTQLQIDSIKKASETRLLRADTLYLNALNLRKDKNSMAKWYRSIALLTESIELNSNDIRYYFERARGYWFTSEFSKAIPDLDKALEFTADYGKVQYAPASLYYMRGICRADNKDAKTYSDAQNLEYALSDLKIASTQRKDYIDVYCWALVAKASNLYKSGDAKQAIVFATEAYGMVKSKKVLEAILLVRMQSYESLGMTEEAFGDRVELEQMGIDEHNSKK
jgi:serine/threonine protein kinase